MWINLSLEVKLQRCYAYAPWCKHRNSNSNSCDNVYGASSSQYTATVRVHLVHLFRAARAPGGSRPLDHTDRSEPQICLYHTNHCHLLLLSPKADTHFTIPRRVEGWVDLAGWLRTEMVYLPVVTHHGINQAYRRVTSMTRQSTLPLRQATNQTTLNKCKCILRQFESWQIKHREMACLHSKCAPVANDTSQLDSRLHSWHCRLNSHVNQWLSVHTQYTCMQHGTLQQMEN